MLSPDILIDYQRKTAKVPVGEILENVRDKILNIAKNRTDSKYGNKDCEAYVDYREVISRDDIDAVHIATPDHWHAQMVIDACRHGKDVFCQKPETRTIEEGPLMVDAVHRYGRIFSGGSQRVMEDYSSVCLLYTSPSPRDLSTSRMPSSA